jgi:hypothetical protein
MNTIFVRTTLCIAAAFTSADADAYTAKSQLRVPASRSQVVRHQRRHQECRERALIGAARTAALAPTWTSGSKIARAAPGHVTATTSSSTCRQHHVQDRESI